MENTFYCTQCETACGETCRDCGNGANVVEICGRCGEVLDNCDCGCEHESIRVEEILDVDGERARRFDAITCGDCGAELIETRAGKLVARGGAR